MGNGYHGSAVQPGKCAAYSLPHFLDGVLCRVRKMASRALYHTSRNVGERLSCAASDLEVGDAHKIQKTEREEASTLPEGQRGKRAAVDATLTGRGGGKAVEKGSFKPLTRRQRPAPAAHIPRSPEGGERTQAHTHSRSKICRRGWHACTLQRQQ